MYVLTEIENESYVAMTEIYPPLSEELLLEKSDAKLRHVSTT